MKKHLLILAFSLSLFSCTSLEKGGWVTPQKQKSKFMEITTGGFNAKITNKDEIELRYSVGVKFDTARPSSNWLIVEFEDPKNNSFVKKSFHLTANQESIDFYSDKPVCGLKELNSYLVKLTLSSDEKGLSIVDSLNQYIRLSGVGLIFKIYDHC